jgi:hypothetical protein
MLRITTLMVFTAGAALAACSDQPLPTDPLGESTPQLAIRLDTEEGSPGPPYYSPIQPGWFPMTEEWAAIPWVRQPGCVPADFNILTLLDLTILFPPAVPFPGPRPFFCPLTVAQHEIWNTDPPDPAIGPLNVTAKGKGDVPIYFVKTSVLLPMIAGGSLTIADLQALDGGDLRIGHATHFTLTNQLGTARGRPGTGKINITAKGTLEGGGTFFFQTAEGPPYKLPIAHTRIDIR